MSVAQPTAGGPQAAAPPEEIPWFGLAGVLLGTFLSTLNSRLSVFGMNDLRGALHAGFDEGAWITTAQATGQMLVLPFAIWLGGVYGPRRVLIQSALAFAVISLLEPLSRDLRTLLVMQFLGGAASGFFIPLTLSSILRNMPPRYWAYGIALYALNLELSLNISASLEAWYVDHLSWRWIFWQNVPLALGMAACFLLLGRRTDPLPAPPPMADRFGLAASSLGLALIYAGLDQGNRLDWLNSGLVCGLLASGVLLVGVFFIHERFHPHPFIDTKVAFAPPLPRLLINVAFLRLTILSTAYLIPQYLITVRGFRSVEVGETLIWIAAPQIIICLIAAVMLRRLDPRLVASFGYILISVACLTVARGLTSDWSARQFLPSLLLQAVGQSLALSGVIFFGVLHLRPQDALTFGAALQTARLLGGEIGSSFTATLLRVRSQIASNHIGLHLQTGDPDLLERLRMYAAATGRDVGPGVADGRAVLVLGQVVRRAAATQGIIDTFVVLAGMTALALALIVAHKPAPIGPASHLPLFSWRRSPPSPSRAET
jgi:DHA2 family multidrug resistance protein